MTGSSCRVAASDIASRIVIARRLPMPVLSALLALLAVFGVCALSGWHASNFEDLPTAHGSVLEHVHDHDHDHANQTDPDGAVHIAAHAVAQGMAIPDAAVMTYSASSSALLWTSMLVAGRLQKAPFSLLRPPRA